MKIIAAVIALFAARVASAGECSPEDMTTFLEREVKKDHVPNEPDGWHLCLWWNVPTIDKDDPKLAKRLHTACEKMLTIHPEEPLCTSVAALLHEDQLGKTDVVETIAKRDLSDRHNIEFLGGTRSVRASPIIVEAWKQLQMKADAKPDNQDVQVTWAAWRDSAAAALGDVGDASARAFLAEQITHKIDRGVKRIAAKSIDAIDKRLGSSK